MPSPMPPPDYAELWHVYRRSNWAAGLCLVLGLPAVVLVAVGLKYLAGVRDPIFVLVPLTVLWAFAFFALARRITRFKCPRCRGLYFAHRSLALGQGRQCAHCKLPLHASAWSALPGANCMDTAVCPRWQRPFCRSRMH
jgi:hypothetical protein